MSIRGGAWLAGACLAPTVSACLAIDPSTRHLAAALGLVSLALAGLFAELAAVAELSAGRPRKVAPHDPTPADGIVGITPLPGLGGPANRADERWRRFQPAEGVNSRPAPRPGLPEASPTFLGRVTIFSIFLGAVARPWTDEEVAAGHASLERAGAWLEREAIRHDAPVQVELGEVYFQAEAAMAGPIELDFVAEGDDVGPLEANAGIKYLAIASRLAADLGFADIADLQGRVNELAQADRRVWLLHLRQAGRSIAIPAADSDLDGVGLAVCFARESSFPEPLEGPGRVDPTTVAHELLHLFGASDKYGAPIRSFPARSVSSREIMRLDHDALHRMRVDPLTAEEIGWRAPSIRLAGKREARRKSR